MVNETNTITLATNLAPSDTSQTRYRTISATGDSERQAIINFVAKMNVASYKISQGLTASPAVVSWDTVGGASYNGAIISGQALHNLNQYIGGYGSSSTFASRFREALNRASVLKTKSQQASLGLAGANKAGFSEDWS